MLLQKGLKSRKVPSIMVVDDDADTANLFRYYLECMAFQVDSFTDPLMALSSFRPKYYDLLIFDVKMPSMNGFQLYQEIRRIDDTCKACFVTAFEIYYKSLVEFFPSLDVTCFIKKPISKNEFIKRINRELSS